MKTEFLILLSKNQKKNNEVVTPLPPPPPPAFSATPPIAPSKSVTAAALEANLVMDARVAKRRAEKRLDFRNN